jgi:hypothetical protein
MTEISEVIDSLLQIFYANDKHTVKILIPHQIPIPGSKIREEIILNYDDVVKSMVLKN